MEQSKSSIHEELRMATGPSGTGLSFRAGEETQDTDLSVREVKQSTTQAQNADASSQGVRSELYTKDISELYQQIDNLQKTCSTLLYSSRLSKIVLAFQHFHFLRPIMRDEFLADMDKMVNRKMYWEECTAENTIGQVPMTNSYLKIPFHQFYHFTKVANLIWPGIGVLWPPLPDDDPDFPLGPCDSHAFRLHSIANICTVLGIPHSVVRKWIVCMRLLGLFRVMGTMKRVSNATSTRTEILLAKNAQYGSNECVLVQDPAQWQDGQWTAGFRFVKREHNTQSTHAEQVEGDITETSFADDIYYSIEWKKHFANYTKDHKHVKIGIGYASVRVPFVFIRHESLTSPLQDTWFDFLENGVTASPIVSAEGLRYAMDSIQSGDEYKYRHILDSEIKPSHFMEGGCKVASKYKKRVDTMPVQTGALRSDVPVFAWIEDLRGKIKNIENVTSYLLAVEMKQNPTAMDARIEDLRCTIRSLFIASIAKRGRVRANIHIPIATTYSTILTSITTSTSLDTFHAFARKIACEDHTVRFKPCVDHFKPETFKPVNIYIQFLSIGSLMRALHIRPNRLAHAICYSIKSEPNEVKSKALKQVEKEPVPRKRKYSDCGLYTNVRLIGTLLRPKRLEPASTSTLELHHKSTPCGKISRHIESHTNAILLGCGLHSLHTGNTSFETLLQRDALWNSRTFDKGYIRKSVTSDSEYKSEIKTWSEDLCKLDYACTKKGQGRAVYPVPFSICFSPYPNPTLNADASQVSYNGEVFVMVPAVFVVEQRSAKSILEIFNRSKCIKKHKDLQDPEYLQQIMSPEGKEIVKNVLNFGGYNNEIMDTEFNPV